MNTKKLQSCLNCFSVIKFVGQFAPVFRRDFAPVITTNNACCLDCLGAFFIVLKPITL